MNTWNICTYFIAKPSRVESKKNSGLVCSQLCSYQLCFVAKPLGGVSSQDFGSLQHLPAMSLRSEIFRKCLYCNLDQIKP